MLFGLLNKTSRCLDASLKITWTLSAVELKFVVDVF